MLLDPKAKGNVLDAKIGFVAPVFLALHHLPLIKLSNYRKQLFSCFLLSAEIHPLKDFLPNVAFNKTTFTNCLKKKVCSCLCPGCMLELKHMVTKIHTRSFAKQ